MCFPILKKKTEFWKIYIFIGVSFGIIFQVSKENQWEIDKSGLRFSILKIVWNDI